MRAAARQGATAAVSSALLAVAIALLAWLPDAGVSGRPGGVVRAGLVGFLAAHHGGITVDGTPMQFLPLGALLIVLGMCWRSAGALLDGVGTAQPGWTIGGFTLGYAAMSALFVPFASVGGSAADVASLLAAVLVAALACAGRFARAGVIGRRPPSWLRSALRPAAAATLGYLGVGAILTAASLVGHAATVERLSASVGGGLAGVPLVLVGILTAPNAVIAGSAYAAGPGFAVGSGIGPFTAGHGVLPAFPLLAAVPAGRAPVAVLVLLALAVVACGVVPGLMAARERGTWRALRCAGLSGLVAGLAMALLTWQGGGAVGTGRLRTVGASPAWTGLAVAGETALVGAAVIGGVAAARWFRDRGHTPSLRAPLLRWWPRRAGEASTDQRPDTLAA